MRSLFLKIFVWFWAAMVLVGVVLVVLIIVQDAPGGPGPLGLRLPIPPPGGARGRHRAFDGESIAHQTRQAVNLFEREGEAGIAPFLEHLRAVAGAQPFFFDSQLHQIAGDPAPQAGVELAQRTLSSGEVEFQGTVAGLLVAASAQDSQGRKFILVSLLPRRLLGFGFNPADMALRFLAVLVTAGILCYGLARYLTAPMAKLQNAARQLGSGDLGTRVDPHLRDRQDEFGQLGRDFDRMAERIEQLLQSQRRLLGDISHELRSPLARLVVALELARKRAGEEAHGALDRMEREAERMNELIGQLLRLTRLEADAMVPEGSPVALAPLVREIAEDADFEARGGERQVGVSLTRCDSCVASGSPEMLRSAIENIVRNAVHYTSEGSSVEIALVVSNGATPKATILVRDHGAGVPEDALGDLFRPFYRVDDARARESGGIGLGLAITQRIVQLHQGQVRARNARGGGLEVEIELPVTIGGHEE